MILQTFSQKETITIRHAIASHAICLWWSCKLFHKKIASPCAMRKQRHRMQSFLWWSCKRFHKMIASPYAMWKQRQRITCHLMFPKRVLFNVCSPKSGTYTFEKCFENAFSNVGSTIQNLRLGWVNLFVMILQTFSHEDSITIRHAIASHRIACNLFCDDLANVFTKW